jgi:hypothetical protein
MPWSWSWRRSPLGLGAGRGTWPGNSHLVGPPRPPSTPPAWRPQALSELNEHLLPRARSRNLRWPSDYIGSYIFDDPMNPAVAATTPRRTLRQLLRWPRRRPDQPGEAPAKARDIDVLLLDPSRIIPARATTPVPIHEHSDFWPDPMAAVTTQELLREYGRWPQKKRAPRGRPPDTA